MDTTGKKLFKTAVVGGFNRDDVCAYIESLVNEHNEEIAKLRGEIKDGATQNINLRTELDDLRVKLKEAEENVADLTAQLEEKTAIADKANELEQKNDYISEELNAKTKECSELSAKVSELNAKVGKYAFMEEEYTSNKSRLAELELSAIARAAELEQEAERKAKVLDEQAKARYDENCEMIAQKRRSVQLEMNKIMSDVASSYNRLQSEISGFNSRFDDLINNTKANIQMLNKSTCGISANFRALEEKCSKLMPEEQKTNEPEE